MLENFRGRGWRKLYMVFALTDETYALLSGVSPPEGVDSRDFYFSIAALAVVMLHVWKKNNMLSIVGGTILYMVLVQAVF